MEFKICRDNAQGPPSQEERARAAGTLSPESQSLLGRNTSGVHENKVGIKRHEKPTFKQTGPTNMRGCFSLHVWVPAPCYLYCYDTWGRAADLFQNPVEGRVGTGPLAVHSLAGLMMCMVNFITWIWGRVKKHKDFKDFSVNNYLSINYALGTILGAVMYQWTDKNPCQHQTYNLELENRKGTLDKYKS